MSRGTDYLAFITEKLKHRLQELNEKILEGQKDVEGMHEYYWQNYTEMDQYGYENFDNQQALLMQVNANSEHLKMRQRLRRMEDSPFFGSVDFLYEGEEEPEIFYIGIGNFSQRAGSIPLVYDWRAPASGLFYDYDKGTASYEAPGGRMEGEILSKWQYKIRGGRMLYEFESDTKIDDDILKQELGANSDIQLKNIVRTIQKEQNAIIRNTKDKIMVIQGAAGSGKTSIALHRIAYLLYHDREHLKSSNVLILSPNGVFSDYISHILPELGEEHIQEMSFDLFAYRELQDTVGDCEDRYHYIENQIRSGKTRHWEWKQSADYVRYVEGFLVDLEDRLVDFRDVDYRGYSKTSSELMHLFYCKFPEIPLLGRMKAVMEYYIDEYETLYNTELKEDALEALKERFMGMYVTRDIYRIYNWLLEDMDLPLLEEAEREKRFLAYEDVYPILYLKYRLTGSTNRRQIRHLVIDEMQDYTYLQYCILNTMFSCNMTILGDRAQTIAEKPHDVLQFLPGIFGKRIQCIEIRKSYRNTAEIAEYAMQISGVTDIEYLQRHGKPVEECRISADMYKSEELLRMICEKLQLRGDTYETAAILTMTEEEAYDCYQRLKKLKLLDELFYIDRDTSEFKRGLSVTTFYQAKGLEFDQVFLLGGDPQNAFYSQFQYIGATRALHELYIYHFLEMHEKNL